MERKEKHLNKVDFKDLSRNKPAWNVKPTPHGMEKKAQRSTN